MCGGGVAGTLISPPLRHRPGNPFSAPAYGSSGSALLPAACALRFSLSLAERMKNGSTMNSKKKEEGEGLLGFFFVFMKLRHRKRRKAMYK